jgi:eukaryotic-like serine/threonine-protein kinase
VPSYDLARWRTVDSLFAEALERPADERTAFLRARCGDDPVLYEEIASLLLAESEAEELIGDSAADFAAPLLPGLRDAIGQDAGLVAGAVVGPYRVIRLLGRGGMGNVFLAARADGAFEKEVALKLIRRGMDTDEVLARFRRERQLLAGLDHPHVARLLDGGVAEDGRPYLVMEVVHGEPITEHCDRLALDIEARLALFERVCAAVQAAHQRLIVHRDLKPSNVLVTPAGEVKLLDFGVAKLLDAPDTDDAPLTRAGARLLTPEYAAPEQIRGEEVTTSADVYSLGVILYELLAGRRPFDVARLAPREREQVLMAEEPPRPSSIVTEAAAASRATSLERLRRRLRGDLDTIVLHALGRQPEERYASVEALVEDLLRQRGRLPVRARPPSRRYRAGRFAARHRTGVIASAAVVLALLAGMGLALHQAGEAARERDLAREVSAFMTDLFESTDPMAAQRRDTLRVAAFLQVGAERVQRDLADRPAMQSQMLRVMGNVYRNLGNLEAARPLLEQAYEVRRAFHGRDHPLATESESDLAELLREQGDYERAGELFENALRARRRSLGAAHPDVASVLEGMADVLRHQSDAASAEPLLREALDIRRQQGPGSQIALATTLSHLGNLLQDLAQFDEAEAAYREALSLRREVLPEDHPHIAVSLANLATVLIQKADHEAAEPIQRQALTAARLALGDRHPMVASSLNSLGWLLIDLKRWEEAEVVLLEALATRRAIYGDEHASVATSLNALGTMYMQQENYADAETYYQESLGLRRRLHGPGHVQVAVGLSNLGVLLGKMGDFARAEQMHREALASFIEVLGEDHRNVATAAGNLGEALHGAGRHEEAIVLFKGALRGIEAALDTDHPSVARVRLLLGACLSEVGRYDEAEPLLLEAHRVYASRGEPATAAPALTQLYSDWKPTEAEALLLRLSLP